MMKNLSNWLSFNLWYFSNPPWETGITPPELVEFVQSHPPGRALDLGCGSGTNLLYLARAGWLVTGVDFAVKAVLQARKRLAQAGVPGDVLQRDVTHLTGLESGFDLVLDIGCFHNLTVEQRTHYTQNLRYLLKAGGCFMIYGHLSQQGDERGIGAEDIQRFEKVMTLINRVEGSERGRKASIWLTFEKPDQG